MKQLKRVLGKDPEPIRFRILIAGRANAGKTSILKKLCGDSTTPIVHDTKGRRIQIDLDPTIGRGIHNVEHEIIYPNRPAFVFHDSRGFEAGSKDEIEALKAFISRRCDSTRTSEQLHIVWYCIAADDERPLPPEELKFFDIDTRQVPVIAIFTKCDALEIKAWSNLRNIDGLSMKDARLASPAVANQLFQEHYLPRLKAAQKQPATYVRLQDLDKPQGSIAALMDCTAGAVGNQDDIQNLFILAQDYELELRTRYGIPRLIQKAIEWRTTTTTEKMVRECLIWLPHVWSPDEVASQVWQPQYLEKFEATEEEDRRRQLREYLLRYYPYYEEERRTEQERRRSMIPNNIVSAWASNLQEPVPLATNFQSLLCLIAGVFAIADRMFWTSKRAQATHLDEKALLYEMQTALALYRSVGEETLKAAIRENFSSSFPENPYEASATGERLARLVQERCHAARSQRT